jgi:DNA-directed RNA polymerase specialized sigma24 family protein
MQTELIDLIHKNYKRYLKYAMRLSSGKEEVAEDIVQNAITYIIEKNIDFEIHNAHSCILTIMKQRYFNYHRVNKKYLLSVFDTDTKFDAFVESRALVNQNDVFKHP